MSFILQDPDKYPSYCQVSVAKSFHGPSLVRVHTLTADTQIHGNVQGLCKNEVDIHGTARRRLEREGLERAKLFIGPYSIFCWVFS